MTRRDFLAAAALASPALRGLLQTGDATFVGLVPLGAPGAASPPFGRLLGDGLDARLFTDLSTLGLSDDPLAPQATRRNPQSARRSPATTVKSPQAPVRNPQSAARNSQSALVTPTDRFFVRTAAPPSLPRADAWTIAVGGLVKSEMPIALHDLEPLIAAPSRVLLECSGNADPLNYGLLSSADWEGVPFAAVLDRLQPSAAAWRVLISGIDDTSRAWRTSVAGASWIFSRGDLQRALLAVRMNGAPLTADHGAPVRLLVPGWYGCACIKWIDRIELVPDEAPATSQMREFAARTHQRFAPAGASTIVEPPPLARDYVPAVIDTAAMPVRVEKWRVGGRVEYRIVGILWGGSKPTGALSIRVRAGGPWARVEDCPVPESTLTWSLWRHTWRPSEPGRYQIVLRVDDPTIRTRRLDIFFYVREVQIDEV